MLRQLSGGEAPHCERLNGEPFLGLRPAHPCPASDCTANRLFVGARTARPCPTSGRAANPCPASGQTAGRGAVDGRATNPCAARADARHAPFSQRIDRRGNVYRPAFIFLSCRIHISRHNLPLKRFIRPFGKQIATNGDLKRFSLLQFTVLGKPASHKGEQNGEETFRCRHPRSRRFNRIP